MDFIVDFLMEFVFEGAFGSFTENKLPKGAKIAIITVCNLIVAGLFGMGLYLANEAGDKIGVVIFSALMVLDVIVYSVLLYCILQRVKYGENKGEKKNAKR